MQLNINVRNIDIYLGTISYKDKCYKSERIRSVLRQLQPFCVRGVIFNNLSTHSSRRLCATYIYSCAQPTFQVPKIYFIYIIHVKQEHKEFLLPTLMLRPSIFCSKAKTHTGGLKYLSSLLMREVENCT